MIQFPNIIIVLILSDQGFISWYENNVIVYDQINLPTRVLVSLLLSPAAIWSSVCCSQHLSCQVDLCLLIFLFQGEHFSLVVPNANFKFNQSNLLVLSSFLDYLFCRFYILSLPSPSLASFFSLFVP